MDELNELWQQFKSLRRGGEEGSREADSLYREQIWPLLRERWRVNPLVEAAMPTFSASIHTLGTSPEATMLAILATNAERVFLLHTAESRRYVQRIRDELRRDITAREVPKSDPAELYREVGEILKEVGGPLAFDITSGTKAMTAGLAAAAFFAQERGLEVRAVYVDNDDYDQEARRPRPGSERLIFLLNPYAVMAELDFEKARTLYDSGNFGQAGQLFETIAERTGDYRSFMPYRHLSAAYNFWYNNQFSEAEHAFAALFRELDKPAYQRHGLRRHLGTLRRQHEGVGRLAALVEAYKNDATRLSTLAESETMLWLLASLNTMQARFARGDAGNYTAAGLLCYRALEVASQHRLALRGFDSLSPDYSILGMTREALTAQYQNAWQQVASKKQGATPRAFPLEDEPVPLFEGYLLLNALDDELTRRPIHSKLLGLAELRNKSSWVHGYAPISQDEHRQLRGIFENILNALLELESEGRSYPAEPIPLD